jgi:hypothetical protein
LERAKAVPGSKSNSSMVIAVRMAVSRGRVGNRRAGMIVPPCESYKYGILPIWHWGIAVIC